MSAGLRPPPLPHPSVLTQPFWDATAREELLLQRCEACGAYVFYPRHNCTACGARALEWVKAGGTGTVFTYTVARRPTHPGFADRVPYVIAVVELDEGPRMTTNLVDCSPEDVSIGMRVEVVFGPLEDGLRLPYFRPAA